MKLHIIQNNPTCKSSETIKPLQNKIVLEEENAYTVHDSTNSGQVERDKPKRKRIDRFPLDTIKNSKPINQIVKVVNDLPKKEFKLFSHSPEHIKVLNIHRSLCASLDRLNMTKPTGIQTQTIQTMFSKLPEPIAQSLPFTMYDYHQFLKHRGHSLEDLVIRSPTGSGKSLAYLIPMLHTMACLCQSTSCSEATGDYFSTSDSIDRSHNVKLLHHNMDRSSGTFAIVITPTRELAIQLCELTTKLVNFPKHDTDGNDTNRPRWITPGAFLSGVSRDKEKARLRAGVSIVFTTPGRLLDHLENTKSWSLRNLSWIVLEEADRFQELHFSECLSKCWDLMSKRTFFERSWQLLLVSATITLENVTNNPDGSFASLKLRNPLLIEPLPESQLDGGGISIPSQIVQYLLQTPLKMRHLALISIIKHWKTFLQAGDKGSRMIIFMNTCDSVDYLFKLLALMGDENSSSRYVATNTDLNSTIYCFHGKLDAIQRADIMKRYCSKDKDGEDSTLKIFLTTNVSARGLDFPAISIVVQYDLPFDSIDYVHKIGRTARMESLGTCVLFALPHERQVILEVVGRTLEMYKCSWDIQEISLVKVLSGHESPLSKEDAENNTVEVGVIPNSVKKELENTQDRIERLVRLPSLSELARDAFLASTKAYASYPKELKMAGIHQKALHLGHYARSFGLRDAPTKIARDRIEEKGNVADEYVPKRSSLLPSKLPRALRTSEFDSGTTNSSK